MNKEQRAYWGAYLRDLADNLRLRDWTVITSEEQASGSRIAECQCVFGRRSICIKFQVGFDRLPPEEQRETCVHELLHAHFAAHDQHMHDARQMMNKLWMHQLGDAMHVDLEYGIDALADIIADVMPLPPEVPV